jgi:hypothetical protein
MSGSRLLILLTPDFMYYQRSHTDIKSQAQDIQSFIPRAAFPRKLGFIEIPYSQGPSFFNNLAIYHEIGHFVYEELSNRAPSGKLYENLVSVQDRCLNRLFNVRKDDTSRVESKRQALAVAARVLENWTQEIFCDLFALRLLGPAFSFMLIEMMGMLGLSQAECEKFDPDHPALAYRFSEHKNQLQDDFWWTRIAGLRAEQKRRLEELAAMPRRHYKFFVDGKNRGPEKLMNAFIDDVVPAIRKLARHVTRRAVPVVRRFDRAQAHIQSCLRAGIVPLTDTRDRRDPVSIINAAFWFYLTSIPEVIKEFESPKDENSVAVHSKWKERVEMWAMKAIEDSQIMTRYKGSISRGPI